MDTDVDGGDEGIDVELKSNNSTKKYSFSESE